MNDISTIIFTCLEGLVFFLAFALLSNRRELVKINNSKMLIFTFIYTLYSYWITTLFPGGLYTILNIFLTVIVSYYVFNSTLVKSLVKTFFIVLSITIIEILVSLFGMVILNRPMSILLENSLYVLVCSIISKTIEFSLVFILYQGKINIGWLNDAPMKDSRFKQILVIISSVLFLMLGSNVYILDAKQAYLGNIFSLLIFVILIITVLLSFSEGSKMEITQFASDLKKESIQELVEFNEIVAKERHEYKNHLNTIYGLCSLNKPDLNEKIKHYINNYANNSETKNIGITSGNDFVDAVINVKYNNALRNGIDLIADFKEPLSSADIGEDTAVTIISNIIENAFEAMNNCHIDGKFVKLETYIKNNKYYISISNNGPMIMEAEKKKIFNAGFSTKDNTSKKRGFGLSIVKTNIERNDGDIKIYSNDNLTQFIISLKVIQQAVI